jgi:hypothetical protein
MRKPPRRGDMPRRGAAAPTPAIRSEGKPRQGQAGDPCQEIVIQRGSETPSGGESLTETEVGLIVDNEYFAFTKF